VIVSQLSINELRGRLAGPGLSVRTGPFVNCLRSPLPEIERSLPLLYADFPVVSDGEFVDFYLNVVPVGGVRRWLFPRAYFLIRGQQVSTFGQFPPQLASSFLEWGMNFAVYGQLNSYLILHAGVLERGGQALLILGDSGAGKSTLCAALMLSGWRLLSDEMALVGLDDGLVYPLVRPVSLKNESIAVIQRFCQQATMGPICRTKRKGVVAHVRPPTDSVRRMDMPVPPRWIVFVRYQAETPLRVEEPPRVEAFMELVRSGFNYYQLGEVGFRASCRTLDQSVCRRVHYGNLQEVLAHFEAPCYRGD
jgi:HprK-related kinase A